MGIPDASVMLQNLGLTVPELIRLVTAIAYVMGMYLVIKGLIGLKEIYEKNPNGGQNPGAFKTQLVLIGCGSALLYLPSSVQVVTSTFWKNSSPLAYVTEQASQYQEFINTVYDIIMLVGAISVIRAFLLFSEYSQDHIKKGIAHLIGGVFCINMELFLSTVFSTFANGSI